VRQGCGNLIVAPTLNSALYSFELHLAYFTLFCVGEAIDTLLEMKGKLTKE